jgi:hypothetical protein
LAGVFPVEFTVPLSRDEMEKPIGIVAIREAVRRNPQTEDLM